MSDMTPDQISELTGLLSQLKPGVLPYPVFEQIARLVALPIVEIIPLRETSSETIEVLLIDRGPDDPIFPNLLHTPGTVVRATDLHKGETHDLQAFRRIIDDELKGTKVGPTHYFGNVFHNNKRGTEQAQLYWVEVLDEPKVGQFYDTADLPDSLMESQRDFIDLAVKAYRIQQRADQNLS